VQADGARRTRTMGRRGGNRVGMCSGHFDEFDHHDPAARCGGQPLPQHHTALFVAVIAFVVFTVVSTATVGLIYLYYARRPGDAEEHLSDLRDRVVRAGPVLFAAVSLLVGAYLVVDGITALV